MSAKARGHRAFRSLSSLEDLAGLGDAARDDVGEREDRRRHHEIRPVDGVGDQGDEEDDEPGQQEDDELAGRGRKWWHCGPVVGLGRRGLCGRGCHRLSFDVATPRSTPSGVRFLRAARIPSDQGVHLFHYHLVTSKVRLLEARYLGKLGFSLVGRYGWRGESSHWFEAGNPLGGVGRLGFRVPLLENAPGGGKVRLQPGHWDVPRVDHLGFALDDEEYDGALDRAADLGLKIQDHPGKRTFIATEAGYRLEVHPPRDWIEDVI